LTSVGDIPIGTLLDIEDK